MGQSLPVLSTAEPARACVWVDAGVLNYRLCDRAFACESCPLDAAIRGDPRLIVRDSDHERDCAEAPWSFPCDRLYADNHLWVQVIDARCVRTGIDACAACLLANVRRARPIEHAGIVERGGALCALELEGGELTLRSPVSGLVCAWNESLGATPGLLTGDPYAGGWIAEIALAEQADLGDLRNAGPAQERARMAARRFGRQAGLALLERISAEESWIGPELLEATRRAVGAEAYLSMIRGALL